MLNSILKTKAREYFKKFVNLEGVDNELNTKYECLSKWRSLKQFDAIVEQKLDVTLHIRQIER